MWSIGTVASLVMSSSIAFAAGNVPFSPHGSARPKISQHSALNIAQNCGFFAILGCFKTRGEAIDWNDRIQGGRVINTSRDDYPNFRPGYYCVMAGPTSEPAARSIARGWKGVIPDAYVKNSC